MKCDLHLSRLLKALIERRFIIFTFSLLALKLSVAHLVKWKTCLSEIFPKARYVDNLEHDSCEYSGDDIFLEYIHSLPKIWMKTVTRALHHCHYINHLSQFYPRNSNFWSLSICSKDLISLNKHYINEGNLNGGIRP